MVGICGYQIQSATPKHSISLNPKRVLQYLKDFEQYSYQLLEKSSIFKKSFYIILDAEHIQQLKPSGQIKPILKIQTLHPLRAMEDYAKFLNNVSLTLR